MGRALINVFPEGTFLTRTRLDVTNPEEAEGAVSGHGVVIHCAAWTDVDGCEADPQKAHNVNAAGTLNVVRAAERYQAKVVYISTDYVFDGEKNGEYGEEDPVGPLNVYGSTKLEGERHVIFHPGNLIVRTSWLFGDGRNFVRSIAQRSRTQNRLSVVGDQRGRPTNADDLARSLGEAVRQDLSGVLHVAGEGPTCTWAEFAREISSLVGSRAVVDAVDSDSYARMVPKRVAPRPRNSTLNLDKARGAGIPLATWRESLERYLRGTE